MKKFFALVIFVCCAAAVQAQYVTKHVTFDDFFLPDHNDYTIWFSGGTGYTYQMPVGPLSGYVIPPDSNAAGDGEPVYCYTYYGPGESCVTSIDFLYDSTAVVNTDSAYAASIRLRASANPAHFLRASVTHDKQIRLQSIDWSHTGDTVLALQHLHWYRLQLSAQFISGFAGWLFTADAAVFDMTSGTPVQIGSDNGGANDAVLPPDTAIYVSFSGAKNGGGAKLDNFLFYGVLGAIQCSPDTLSTDIHQAVEQPVAYTLDGRMLTVTTEPGTQLQITDVSGRIHFVTTTDSTSQRLDLKQLPAGTYLLTLRKNDVADRTTRFVLTQ